MKTALFLFLVLLQFPVFGQTTQTIHLKRKELDSRVNSVSNEVADHSLRIASYIFNSIEFQDSLSKLSFNYHNLCIGCSPNNDNLPNFKGLRVLDSIFRDTTLSLTLKLKRVGKPTIFGKCHSLGSTCPNTNTIISFYKNINCDMGADLPFEYAYAVHICHEYAHNVGYCHTYTTDDVAEAVGNIAFYFMNKWYQEGLTIP